MTPDKLRKGDLILFHSPSGCEHVAMYTGDIDGKPYITHSVTDDNPGLKTTILKKPGAFEHYTVLRLNNSDLAEKAWIQLLYWAKYQIPYDQRRANLMHRINNVIRMSAIRSEKEPSAALLEYLELQAERKFYEIVKFAARRNTSPVKFYHDTEARGFTCVQAIILAYRVAELAPYVKTLQEVKDTFLKSLDQKDTENREIWISDKYCDQKALAASEPPDSFIDYQSALNDSEEFTDFNINDKRSAISNLHYQSSLSAWRYDLEPSIELFKSKFKSCLNLPAKICYPGSLETYLLAHPESWLDLGKFDTTSLRSEFTVGEKTLHKSRSLTFLSDVSLYRTRSISERSISPRTIQSTEEEEVESTNNQKPSSKLTRS